MPDVLIPSTRIARWVANFEERHGPTLLIVADGGLVGTAADGSEFAARLPFDTAYDGPAGGAALAAAVGTPASWGVLLVRKGGFAIARLEQERMVEHKIGQRHVQGRTKAGGQSQQRFARRRGNQARQAFEAAADHAARILDGVPVVITGGDHTAVHEVLADSRLRHLTVTGPFLAVPDPRRRELDDAVRSAQAVAIAVFNAALSAGDPSVPEEHA